MGVVTKTSASKCANVIGSHVRCIRKMDGSLKARICHGGNHETEKNYLRTDAPCMLMEVFRLVISIGVENQLVILSMYVRAAFIKADGFSRTTYVRPHCEEFQPNILWKLLAPAYGLVDCRRPWYLTINSALCNDNGLSRSFYESTLYF